MSHNCTADHVRYLYVKLLKTNRNVLHIRNQSVLCSKHHGYKNQSGNDV